MTTVAERIEELLASRKTLHSEMLAVVTSGQPITQRMIDLLNEFNEELADLGAVPMITL